jgi:hypothetical protein
MLRRDRTSCSTPAEAGGRTGWGRRAGDGEAVGGGVEGGATGAVDLAGGRALLSWRRKKRVREITEADWLRG